MNLADNKTTIYRVVSLLAGCFAVASVQADLIDFESGFVGLAPVTTVATATNTATFGAGAGYHQGIVGPAFVTERGGIPSGGVESGFTINDLPMPGFNNGNFFLTDEIFDDIPVNRTFDYFIDFAIPVWELTVDFLDYRGEGFDPANRAATEGFGKEAVLTGYADAARTVVVSVDSFVTTPNLLDALVVQLSLPDIHIPMAAFTLSYDYDNGTAIDNILFHTATSLPESATLGTMAVGLLMLGLTRRRG